MEHRHLESPGYTLAAIDDVIARGSLSDWEELDAAASDARVVDKIRTVVMARSDDESSINHDFGRTRMHARRRAGSASPVSLQIKRP